MKIEYDDYDEPIYDEKYYKIDVRTNLKVNDIIEFDDIICKIINITFGKQRVSFEYINIFTNTKHWTLFSFSNNRHVLFPIIDNIECDLICMTDDYFEIFDENNNEIIEIKINEFDDKNIIKKINDNVNNDSLKLIIIKFKNLIKVIDAIV